MRKITLLLFVFLLTAVGAWAQGDGTSEVTITDVTRVTEISTGKWYLLENGRGGISYLYANANGVLKREAAGQTASTLSSQSVRKDALVQLIKDADAETYELQTMTGKYFPQMTGSSLIVTGKGSAGKYYIHAVDKSDGTKTFQFGTKSTGGIILDNNNAGADVVGWSPSGAGEHVWATSNTGQGNNEWKVYEVTFSTNQLATINVNIKNEGENDARYTSTMTNLPVGLSITPRDYLSPTVFFEYGETTEAVAASDNNFDVSYTELVPFASSYEGLGGDENGNKWVSFYTLNGRMHVYDDYCVYNNVKKYPTIDKATFTNLTDNKFWGFICEDPFASPAIVKIVNKGAGNGKTLYLTTNNEENTSNDPLLLGTTEDADNGTWTTNEWIIEKSTRAAAVSTGDAYYGIKAKGYKKYINNFQGAGFMVTWKDGANNDDGSNIKFVRELDTYITLKDRALSAPRNAVNSLNHTARVEIETYDRENPTPTVAGYKEVIKDINDANTSAGFINFDETGATYYFLRNYTPAGDGEKTYVLASEDGVNAKAFDLSYFGTAGDNETVMTSSNINSIWKITKANPNDNGYTGDSESIGISKTIGRHVTHVNSGKKLSSDFNVNRNDGNVIIDRYAKLTDAGSTFYFVNLGAGQHFLKNTQYVGDGTQAKAMPLSVQVDKSNNNTVIENTDGTAMLERRSHGTEHFKNSRDTWYGIEATGIEVTIGGTGYATIYLPFGVILPKGLTAYAVTSVDNEGVVTLEGGHSIPAGQGAILKGAANTTYTLFIDDSVNDEAGEVSAWSNNCLLGSNMVSYVEGEGYVLADGTSGVGLYKAELNKGANGAEGTTHFQNNGNKAYLKHIVPGARFLSFDFGTETGLDVIKGKEPASSESVVYDLSGRRVRNAQKGMYIVNGKKVIK